MTRKEALESLLAKVEAGDWDFRASAPARQVFPYNSSSADDLGLTARAAFDGSLDAANALHEAVLPGWTIRLCAYTPHGRSAPYAHVFKMREVDSDPVLSGNSAGYEGDSPSRAWLIAILKALIAQEAE